MKFLVLVGLCIVANATMNPSHKIDGDNCVLFSGTPYPFTNGSAGSCDEAKYIIYPLVVIEE